MSTLQRITSDDDVIELAAMARAIWNEYFPGIIGQQQVDYMVEKFQSVDAITSQINDGYEYYFINDSGVQVGYIGLVPRQELNALQISKLYLLKEARGKGHGRVVIDELLQLASTKGLDDLYLTVNKYNTGAITAYEKMGFYVCGDIVMDIEGGFVMDDYEMKLPVTN